MESTDRTSAVGPDSTGSVTIGRRTALAGLAVACLPAGCSRIRRLVRSPGVSAPEFSRVGDPFPIAVTGVDGDATVEVSATDNRLREFRRRFPVEEEKTVARPRMLLHHLDRVETDDRAADPPVFRAPTRERIDVDVVLRRGGEELDATTVRREYVDPDVGRQRIDREGRHYGTFFEPSGDVRGPGVLTLHGSGGSVRSRMSKLLASRGYPTLALNYEGLNGHSWVRTPVEYLTGAVTWLRNRPEVTDGRIGVVGHSQGARGALLTGIHSSAVGAVVAFDPACTTTGVYQPDGDLPGPAFTLDGDPYWDHEDVRAFWEALLGEIDARGGPGDCDFECYEEAYAALDPEVQAKNTLRVEEIDGPVLLFATGSSPHTEYWTGPERLARRFSSNEWKMRRLVAPAIVRLRQHDHAHDHDLITFENAPHAFGSAPPYHLKHHPSRLRSWSQDHLSNPVSATVRARALAWPHVLDYLAAGIGAPARDPAAVTESTGGN